MRSRRARTGGNFAAASRYFVAAVVLLVGAAPLALAQQAGGGAAAESRTAPSRGHDDAAGHANGPPTDTSSAPANRAPQEHGSQAAKGARSRPPAEAGQGASDRGGRHTRPSEGTADRGAGVPAIDARHFPGHGLPRPIKDLLPKPYHFPKPAPSAAHQPVPSAGPTRNAIGVPLDHAPIAKPTALAPPIAGTSTAATGARAGATGPVGAPPLRQTVAPPLPLLPRNSALNGSAFSRVGSGPATLGGAARSTTGVNGTSFRPKHGN